MTVILTEMEKIGRCMGSGEQRGREGGRAPLYTGVAFAARVAIKRNASRVHRAEKSFSHSECSRFRLMFSF